MERSLLCLITKEINCPRQGLQKTDVVIEKFGDGAAEHNSFRGAGSVELPAAGLGSLNYLLYVELLAKTIRIFR